MFFYIFAETKENKAMIGTIIASFILLFGFIGLGIFRFGLLPSYSSYAAKWAERVPLPTNLHLWSIITIIAAILLTPAMVGIGEGNYFQFLGFFAPLYLIVVGLTPEYETDARQKRIHVIGAISCAVLAIIWIAFVAKHWDVFLACSFIIFCAALITQTHKKSMIFWGEMALFLSAYVTSFLAYV